MELTQYVNIKQIKLSILFARRTPHTFFIILNHHCLEKYFNSYIDKSICEKRVNIAIPEMSDKNEK